MQNKESEVEDRESMLPKSLRSMATWHGKLHNFDAARKIYEQILQNDPKDYEATLGIITLMGEQGRNAEAIEYLKRMSQSADETTKQDRLTQMFFYLASDDTYHATITKVARQNDSLEFIKNGYETAISVAASKNTKDNVEKANPSPGVTAHLLMHFGFVLNRYHADQNEKSRAIELWEQVLTIKHGAEIDWQLFLARREATKNLSFTYAQRAREAGSASELASQNLQKLDKLMASGDMFAAFDDAMVKYLRGRYHSTVNEKEKAMELLKSSVELGLALLSDEDPSNDFIGYGKLAECFKSVGDDKNALAAWSLIGPTTNLPIIEPPKVDVGPSTETRGNEQSSMLDINSTGDHANKESDSHEAIDSQESYLPSATPFSPPPLKRSATSFKIKKPSGPLSNRCDGRCGTTWTFADDIYVCKDCIDVQFDHGCLELLRKGDLARNVCDKGHDFLHVEKYDFEKAARIGAGNVEVGGNVMTVKEWLDSIKKEWDVQAKAAVDE